MGSIIDSSEPLHQRCELLRSPDSKYLYFVRETPDNPQAMRIRLADFRVESVVSLKEFRRVSDPTIDGYSWVGCPMTDLYC